jgi:hypothetical protein
MRSSLNVKTRLCNASSTFILATSTSARQDTATAGNGWPLCEGPLETGLLSERRPHHYLFVHRTLPNLILTKWEQVKPTLADGTARARLQAVWDGLGQKLPPEARLDSETLDCQTISLGEERGYLLTFPPPIAVAEGAYAIVPDGSVPRYFVLELGFNPVTRQPSWVFCEWTRDGHFNGGAVGPEVAGDPQDALESMKARVKEVLDIRRA